MKRRIITAIVVMGFSGLVAEILLLRELLIVFSGNELCIGIILSNWLLLEAVGCFFPGGIAKKTKNPVNPFAAVTVLFSLTLIPALYLTRLLKNLLGFSVGESIGFVTVFYSSFLILLPVSLLHGALFPLGCRLFSTTGAADASCAGRVYVHETVGTLVGGIVCALLFIPRLNAFAVASGIVLLNLIVCLVLLAPWWNVSWRQKAACAALGMGIVVFGWWMFTGRPDGLHRQSIQAQWRNQHVVHYQNSHYGNISVIENQGQYVYFQDGIPTLITPIPDRIAVEEFVHLPLLAHPDPVKILVVGGGAGGMLNEALKHPSLESIEYVELDPLLLSLLRKFPTPLTQTELDDERVRVRYLDGRLLLRTTSETYDGIFIGISEPSNLQANRYFTKEFFSLAKKRLAQGGFIVFGLPGSFTLWNRELTNLNSCIFHTLSTVFNHVRVIPGDDRNIFLASDSPDISLLDMELLARRWNERAIEPDGIIPWHIEKKLHPGWQHWFARFLEGSRGEINADFKPLGLFYSLAYWNALLAPSFGRFYQQFQKINLRLALLLVVLFLAAYFALRALGARAFPPAIPLSIATTGFAGMIFSLFVIFSFQTIHGYVFSWIGLLVAFFMAGAASGAMLATLALRRIRSCRRAYVSTELAILGVSILLPFVFLFLNAGMSSREAITLSWVLYLLVSFGSGFLIGAQFPLANRLHHNNTAGMAGTAGLLYASDLLGGWLGGIVGAVVLLPVLGMAGTGMTVAMIKMAGFIILLTQLPTINDRR